MQFYINLVMFVIKFIMKSGSIHVFGFLLGGSTFAEAPAAAAPAAGAPAAGAPPATSARDTFDS